MEEVLAVISQEVGERKRLDLAFSSVQSLDRLGRRRAMREDSVKILL